MSTEALQVTPSRTAEGVWIVHDGNPRYENPMLDYFSVLVFRYPGDLWRCERCQRKASANPCAHIQQVQKWLGAQKEEKVP